MTPASPIEAFLDALYDELRDSDAATARRLLAEAESHLRESADALVTTGVERLEAEQAAVERFGTPAEIVAASRPALHARLTGLVAGSVRPLVLLLGAGLVVVGLSGAVAAAMSAAFGSGFVGSMHQTYTASACDHFLAVQPSATSCTQAAALETSHDAIALRLLAGGLGLVLLGLGWLWSRRSRERGRGYGLPPVVWLTVGLTAFAVAAAGLAVESTDLATNYGSDGVGFYLSGAVVAALAAVAFAVPLTRRLLPVSEPDRAHSNR